MDVFLPLAQVSVNIYLILFLSFCVGFLSGLFGIGGGFLMTPILIFIGIPPTYAVANEANNILASSTSGALTHWFKKTMDQKMGWMIIFGGIVGTAIGIIIFGYFKNIGKINLIIVLAYIYILAGIGALMLRDGVMEIDRLKKKSAIKQKLHTHYWIHGLPFRMRFKKSKLYESALVPIILGIFVGFFAAIMGVGGAFLMVPAMIYLIGMPTKLVPGTSLFVTIFITALVTISHAFAFHTIDFLLVLILITGSIAGVHLGTKTEEHLKSSELKTLMSILLLFIGAFMAYNHFFRGIRYHTNNISEVIEMNNFASAILDLATKYPIVYGMSSIIVAVGLGILVSIIRKYLSNKYKKIIK